MAPNGKSPPQWKRWPAAPPSTSAAATGMDIIVSIWYAGDVLCMSRSLAFVLSQARSLTGDRDAASSPTMSRWALSGAMRCGASGVYKAGHAQDCLAS